MRFGGLVVLAGAVAAQTASSPYASLYSNTYYRGFKIDVTAVNTCVEITSQPHFENGMASIHVADSFCYTFKDAECTEFFGQGYDTDRWDIEDGAEQVAIKCLSARAVV